MFAHNLKKASLYSVAISALMVGNAFAGGTDAGTVIQNSFTLDYRVSGVDQPTIDTGASGSNNPTEFTVDRLVDLTVASNGDNAVPPGAQDQDLVFSLSNDGNDTQAYSLTVVDESGDQFSVTNSNIFYYVDDGDNTFQTDGTDGTAQAYNNSETPDLAKDRVLWVVVQADIPSGLQDTDEDVLSLLADTLEPSTAGANAGNPVVADGDSTNSLTGAAENVLADGSGTSNEVANAGDHSATAKFVIASADVAATKAVTIFAEDGSNCATIPGTPAAGEQYAVPGACVEYVITISNTGGTEASNMTINDVLPEELSFVAAEASGFAAGSFATPALPAADTDCTANACEINYTSATLASGSDASPTVGTITIRALVK